MPAHGSRSAIVCLEAGQREAGYDCFRAVARNNPERYGEALSAFVDLGPWPVLAATERCGEFSSEEKELISAAFDR